MNYIRFQEHLFDNEWPRELEETFPLDHINYEEVYETWHLDKPVSRISVYPDWEKEVGALKSCFYTNHEVYDEPNGAAIGRIYFSRFPELVEIAANMETEAIGVLFGFNNRDVASYIERAGNTISSPENRADRFNSD